MRHLIALAVLVAALAVSSAASAGGWATVSLESLPVGVSSGETWDAQITILRHGVTPTDGAAPSVTVRKGSDTETFKAEPTGKTGRYEAPVVFPEAGQWMLEIDNGLVATGYGESATTTFGPVTIGGPSVGAPGGGGFPVLPVAVVAGALALAAAAVFGARRMRRLGPASG
jgi:hypothetical protein